MLKWILNHKKWLVLVLCLIAGGAWYIYGNKTEEVHYITEPVRRQNIQKIVNASGEIRAIQLVTVGAQVSGKIEKLYVTVGQQVKTGDLIAEIDSTTQKNEIEITKAKIASYEAQLSAAEVSLKIAEKQYQRMQKLKKQNAASVEDLENAEDSFESAKSKVTQLKANLAEMKISLNTAETNLGYTRITAPQDGTIVSVPVKQGQTVNANMNTPDIVQIADLSEMEIVMEISEGDIAYVKPGMKVTYTTLADLNTTHETTLKSIDPGLTLLTNAEYSEVVGSNQAIYYYGRLIVPNTDGLLRIGMTTQNEIFIESAENTLTISSTAIRTNEEGKYVEVLTKAGVQSRPITTGVSDGVNVEVLSGLSDGEDVIIAASSADQISSRLANVRGPRL